MEGAGRREVGAQGQGLAVLQAIESHARNDGGVAVVIGLVGKGGGRDGQRGLLDGETLLHAAAVVALAEDGDLGRPGVEVAAVSDGVIRAGNQGLVPVRHGDGRRLRKAGIGHSRDVLRRHGRGKGLCGDGQLLRAADGDSIVLRGLGCPGDVVAAHIAANRGIGGQDQAQALLGIAVHQRASRHVEVQGGDGLAIDDADVLRRHGDGLGRHGSDGIVMGKAAADAGIGIGGEDQRHRLGPHSGIAVRILHREGAGDIHRGLRGVAGVEAGEDVAVPIAVDRVGLQGLLDAVPVDADVHGLKGHGGRGVQIVLAAHRGGDGGRLPRTGGAGGSVSQCAVLQDNGLQDRAVRFPSGSELHIGPALGRCAGQAVDGKGPGSLVRVVEAHCACKARGSRRLGDGELHRARGGALIVGSRRDGGLHPVGPGVGGLGDDLGARCVAVIGIGDRTVPGVAGDGGLLGSLAVGPAVHRELRVDCRLRNGKLSAAGGAGVVVQAGGRDGGGAGVGVVAVGQLVVRARSQNLLAALDGVGRSLGTAVISDGALKCRYQRQGIVIGRDGPGQGLNILAPIHPTGLNTINQRRISSVILGFLAL